MGGGNCLFAALSKILWDEEIYHLLMRKMIVDRIMSFPRKYNTHRSYSDFLQYCEKMSNNGTPGNSVEIQAISDIAFAKVECYSTNSILKPIWIFTPLRIGKMNEFTEEKLKRRIRLWLIEESHVVALVDENSPMMCKPF